MMNNSNKSYLDQFLEDSGNWVVYEQERLANAFGDVIEAAMEVSGDTQSAVAERLNKSPSVISRALNAGSNLTLRTMVEIAAAVGCQIASMEIKPIPSAVSSVWAEPPITKVYASLVSSALSGTDGNAALAADGKASASPQVAVPMAGPGGAIVARDSLTEVVRKILKNAQRPLLATEVIAAVLAVRPKAPTSHVHSALYRFRVLKFVEASGSKVEQMYRSPGSAAVAR